MARIAETCAIMSTNEVQQLVSFILATNHPFTLAFTLLAFLESHNSTHPGKFSADLDPHFDFNNSGTWRSWSFGEVWYV